MLLSFKAYLWATKSQQKNEPGLTGYFGVHGACGVNYYWEESKIQCIVELVYHNFDFFKLETLIQIRSGQCSGGKIQFYNQF